MDSSSPKLPLIDLADETLKPGSSKWVQVRSDVRKALEEYGCFEASYDKVSLELQDSIVKAMEELFSLPVETKKRNVCPKPYVGYLNHNNLSESLGIQNPNILENVDDFAQQLWPDGNKNISETIQLFSEKLAEIDVMVRKMIMESYGIEKYIDEHLNSSNYRMRLMKYTAPPDVDADTTADHEDNVDVGVNVNTDGDDGADAVDGTDPNVGVKVNADVSDEVNANTGVGVDINADVNGDHVDANSDANTGVTVGVNDDADANGDHVDANTAGVTGGVNDDANVNADGGINVNVDVDADGGVIANTGVNVISNVDANDVADAETGAIAGDGVEAHGDGADVDDKKLGLPCHTDKNFITVLFQHEIEGLDVKTKDEKWIRVKPCPNTFVVIAGDSLCVLMNGRIPPAYHRVRVTEKKRTRYTAAIFTCPKPGYIIDSPKELVDEKHPRAFPPFDYLDFFHFYHTEVGSKAPSTLQAYCAVAGA